VKETRIDSNLSGAGKRACIRGGGKERARTLIVPPKSDSINPKEKSDVQPEDPYVGGKGNVSYKKKEEREQAIGNKEDGGATKRKRRKLNTHLDEKS